MSAPEWVMSFIIFGLSVAFTWLMARYQSTRGDHYRVLAILVMVLEAQARMSLDQEQHASASKDLPS